MATLPINLNVEKSMSMVEPNLDIGDQKKKKSLFCIVFCLQNFVFKHENKKLFFIIFQKNKMCLTNVF